MSEINSSRDKELYELKQNYLNKTAPEQGKKQMEESIQKAKKEKRKVVRFRRYKQVGLTAAAALALIIITPNVSRSAAMAMSNIPIIGSIIKVITIRDYKVDEKNHNADVNIPKIEVEGSDSNSSQSADKINNNAEEYIDTLIDQFKANIPEDKAGSQALNINYEITTNTDTWFTLKLSVLDVKASNFQSYRYYNIDKQTGEAAELKDLFREDTDYKTIINDSIKQQMADQMAKDDSIYYWLNDPEVPDQNFQSISDSQNFYFNQDKQLVISFDAYEVAPGYMGAVDFLIPDTVLADIRK